MAGAEVLGILHLHGEEFQELAAHDFIGRKEGKSVIWPPGYTTASRVAEVGITRPP